MAYPTDSGLLARAIRRIAATGRRIQAAGGAVRTRLRDRSRSAGKPDARHRGETAPRAGQGQRPGCGRGRDAAARTAPRAITSRHQDRADLDSTEGARIWGQISPPRPQPDQDRSPGQLTQTPQTRSARIRADRDRPPRAAQRLFQLEVVSSPARPTSGGSSASSTRANPCTRYVATCSSPAKAQCGAATTNPADRPGAVPVASGQRDHHLEYRLPGSSSRSTTSPRAAAASTGTCSSTFPRR